MQCSRMEVRERMEESEWGGTREGGAVKGMLALWKVAMVWDGEVAGMKSALEEVERNKKILILSDSQPAIAAVKKAR